MDSRQYFAALPADEIASELMKRIDDWYTHISTTGIFSRMKKSYYSYYGYSNTNGGTTAEIIRGGVQGELALIKVNHFRNLVQHILVMTTNNRPAMEARAINTDHRSLAQTILANGILDYYLREKKLEEYLKTATENALIFGEGYVGLEWDSSEGDEVVADEETGEIIHKGDLKYTAPNPLDLIRDLYQQDGDDYNWVIVRKWKNKFDLAAKYPELEEKILDTSSKVETELNFDFIKMQNTDSDLIAVYEFYHRKSDALPDGRLVAFLSDDVVLYDGPLPYRGIPIFRISPGNFIGTVHGYTPAFDLLGIQEALDALYSTVVTNQTTFGVQNILLPKGHDISVSQLAGGLNLIEYDSQVGKPEALNLTATPSEVFNFIDKLEKTMETISGVNEVARGNPSPNLRSGNAMALIASMAIQFNSGLQQSYARLLESVGTSTIDTLKDFAEEPRLIMITGQANRSYMKEFHGGDLDKISRVVVDVGNPLSKTTAGKIEIADSLLQQGQVNAQQYINLIKTGNLDNMYEGQLAELMLIKSENEDLSEGQECRALTTDAHALHIQEHKAVLASPDVRRNPEIVSATLKHIEEHIQFLRDTDPGLLAVLGQQPIPQAGAQGGPGGQPPAGAPQGPGEGQPNPGGPGAPQGAPAAMGPTNPDMTMPPNLGQVGNAMQATNMAGNQVPNMPSMPSNPLTGQKFDAQTGGLPGGALPSAGNLPPNLK